MKGFGFNGRKSRSERADKKGRRRPEKKRNPKIEEQTKKESKTTPVK